MTDVLTYPFLLEWYAESKKQMQPATTDWVRSKARGKAGGKAYPANNPLPDDAVAEGVSDAALYKRVYNACVQWAGKALAEHVAQAAIGERDAQTTGETK
jgi:hypothetical protein